MIKRTTKTEKEREAIIAEYLLGVITYRDLGKKHGTDFKIIHSRVTKFRGKPLRKPKPNLLTPEELPADAKQLQEELRKAKLYNELAECHF